MKRHPFPLSEPVMKTKRAGFWFLFIVLCVLLLLN
jgi:hypothetical protein